MKGRVFSSIFRSWGGQWQLWSRRSKSTSWQLNREADLLTLGIPSDALCAVPARQAVAHPFYVATTEKETAKSMALLEVEMLGLVFGERLQKDVSLRLLHVEEGRTLVLAVIYPPEWVPSVDSMGSAFEASPCLAVLGDDALHLWREEDDLVAAVVWRSDLVYWETIPWTLDEDEVHAWLRCVLRQLREDLGLDGALALREWVAIFRETPPEFSRSQTLNDDDRRHGPVPDVRNVGSWLPDSLKSVLARRRQRAALLKFAAGLVVFLTVTTVGGFLAFSSLEARISAADAEIEALEVETAPIRRSADRWRQIEAAVDERFYPLEVLRVVVGGLPPGDVRLTIFEMSPEKILIEGEAAKLSAASAYFDRLQQESPDLLWEMPSPSLQSDNRARFIISGSRGEFGQ